jgi:heat shock protein HslJ
MHNVPVMLSFAEDGSLNAKVVNIIMGQYELNGNNLIIIPSGTTMMMGPKKDMETEQNFIQSLLMVKSYKMQENNLVLEMENGSSMIFEPHNKPNE